MKTQAILIAAVALLLGTEAALIKPAPGTSVELKRPVLSPGLAEVLKFSQISLAATIQKDANPIQNVPELTLRDLNIAIDDDVSVKLSNLKLLNVPAIDVISATPNLEFLNLALDFDFGTVQVGGNFEIVSKNILAQIPVTSSGEFILSNSHVKATGKVGLSLQTNFFETINHDVTYQPSGSRFTVSYLQNNKRIVRELEAQSQETKIVANINRHLRNVFDSLVKKRLDDILGAVPVDRLIGEKLAAEYREHARALRALANDYVDDLMNLVRGFVADSGLSEIAIPEIWQGFEHDVLGITFHGSFEATGGTARNLATLIRTGDCTIDIDDVNGILVVSGNLGLNELRLHWNHYGAEFQGIGVSGGVTVDIGRNSVYMKIRAVMADLTISVEDFRISAQDFKFDITGLGILDWLVSHVTTWIVNLFDETIVGMIESRLRAYIDEMLPNLTLP